MSDRTPQETWAKDLSTTIEQRLRHRPVKHVAARVATVLHSEAIVDVDGHLEQPKQLISGQVSVFTDRSVAIVEVTDVPSMHDVGAKQDGHVDVTILSRRALTCLSILQPADGSVNIGDHWAPSRDSSWQVGVWPWRGRLSLRFEGYSRTVELAADDLAGFLPELLEDLHAQPRALDR